MPRGKMLEPTKKRRKEGLRKEREFDEVVELLMPRFMDMRDWEIKNFLDRILTRINFKFHPFRKLRQALEYEKGKQGGKP